MPTGQRSVDEIFAEAIRRPQGSDRANYLDEVYGQDAAARERMERLLRAHAEADSFLEAPAADPLPTAVHEAPLDERAGTVIGPYKLLQHIGEGGMGVVFMAEQTEPIQRTVALKIIKPGMDTRQVIARFEAERQALAVMDHPNIAKVLDAGTTDEDSGNREKSGSGILPSSATATGRPYFVMELVKGVPINKYCDEKRLSLRERLELFKPVCEAVQHAHQKGIIHRDIKPTNVLVAEYDNRAVPKVIDFGVAKATAQKLTERTIFTEFGQVIGTVEYMSPEQAKFNQLDIDTRSDIYSLGVLLYELLTGSTPFEQKRLREAAFDEVLRIIREEEPPTPSSRLSTSDTLPSVAANRHTEPARLSKDVRGELDWIVMKCLDKERNRRYQSASALAVDIERYLTDQPVDACPPSTAYRLRKFVHRNRGAVIASASGAVAMLLTVVALAVSSVRVAWERDEKDQALLTANSSQARAEANYEEAKKAVDEYLHMITEDENLKNLADFHPLRKNLIAKALPFYERLAQQRGDDHRLDAQRGLAHARLSALRLELGEHQEARKEIERALEIFTRLVADHPDLGKYRQLLARTHHDLGVMFSERGEFQQALREFEMATTILQPLVAELPKPPDALDYKSDMAQYLAVRGSTLHNLGQNVDALAENDRAAALLQELLDHKPASAATRFDVAMCFNERGQILAELGQLAKALTAFQEAARLQKQLSDEFPKVPKYRDEMATCFNNQGIQLMRLRRVKEALAAHDKALTIQEQLVTDFPSVVGHHDDLASSHMNRGNIYRALERRPEALADYKRAIDLADELTAKFPGVPKFRYVLALCHANQAVVLNEVGRIEDSKAASGKAIPLLEGLVAQSANAPIYVIELGNAYKNYGAVLLENGESQAAAPWLTKANETLEPVLAKDPRQTRVRRYLAAAHEGRALSLSALGRYGDALADWDRALELSEEQYRSITRMKRACTLALDGKPTPAVAEANSMLDDQHQSAELIYEAACVFAAAFNQVKDDPALAEQYAVRAVVLLRESSNKGFKHPENLNAASVLAPLRTRPDFQQFVNELEAKKQQSSR